MHLVDAIRLAQKQAQSGKNKNTVPEDFTRQNTEFTPSPVTETETTTTEITTMNTKDTTPEPVTPVVANSGGSVVRLELFLSPEQMHMMLRGILQGAHTVMTLREAAQHLRIPSQTLLHLAESGEIPAFMIDGQWRFARYAVDEWITLQTLHGKTETNLHGSSNEISRDDKEEDVNAA
ncbi:MAG TPA: helix-turn-helix domain-containing protein [Fimbriimonadales bacterium]|nr:helix-turn-helix domain-containing protein [Fimbriimonadales bacterium]